MPTYDPHLRSTIAFLPINVYYPYGPGNEEVIKEIKQNLSNLQNKYKLYLTYGAPTFDDYIKINEMVKANVVKTVLAEDSA